MGMCDGSHVFLVTPLIPSTRGWGHEWCDQFCAVSVESGFGQAVMVALICLVATIKGFGFLLGKLLIEASPLLGFGSTRGCRGVGAVL